MSQAVDLLSLSGSGPHVRAGRWSRVEPNTSSAVGPALLRYLAARLKVSELAYAEEPVEFTEGWEAYSYRFHLRPVPGLPEAFTHPLVVRIYSSPHGLPRARREFAAQDHLGRLGFPVPGPVLVEESSTLFGGPFLLMRYVAGNMLLQAMLRRPWLIFREPMRMAALHARLHQLPADGFPAPREPLLARRFEEMASIICEFRLTDLQPGFDWLYARRPPGPPAPSILHLDYHPANLVRTHGGELVALDWTEADVGDPHADVATALMMLDCMPAGVEAWHDRLAAATGRVFLRRWYLRSYRRRRPLDGNRLAYYRAWATLRRLCNYGRWLLAGPQATGAKPSSAAHLRPEHLADFYRYFARWTGVRVSLGPIMDRG